MLGLNRGFEQECYRSVNKTLGEFFLLLKEQSP